jgi:hypothetical protein
MKAAWLTLLLMTAAGGCTPAAMPVTYQADHPVYATPAELFDKATLVAEVDISARSRVTRLAAEPGVDGDPLTNPQAGLSPAPPPGEGPVITVRAARVVEVFKGTARAGQDIEVQEPGGTLNDVEHRVDDAIPLRAGARYVLFLETFARAPAAMLNPAQGQYQVGADGALTALPGNAVTLTRADLQRLAR